MLFCKIHKQIRVYCRHEDALNALSSPVMNHDYVPGHVRGRAGLKLINCQEARVPWTIGNFSHHINSCVWLTNSKYVPRAIFLRKLGNMVKYGNKMEKDFYAVLCLYKALHINLQICIIVQWIEFIYIYILIIIIRL